MDTNRESLLLFPSAAVLISDVRIHVFFIEYVSFRREYKQYNTKYLLEYILRGAPDLGWLSVSWPVSDSSSASKVLAPHRWSLCNLPPNYSSTESPPNLSQPVNLQEIPQNSDTIASSAQDVTWGSTRRTPASVDATTQAEFPGTPTLLRLKYGVF